MAISKISFHSQIHYQGQNPVEVRFISACLLLSKKSCPIFREKSIHRNGQHLLNIMSVKKVLTHFIQYLAIIKRVKPSWTNSIALLVGLCAQLIPAYGGLLQKYNTTRSSIQGGYKGSRNKKNFCGPATKALPPPPTPSSLVATFIEVILFQSFKKVLFSQ